MEEMYEEDLANATEIVLDARRRVLGPAEAGIMTGAGLALLSLALIGILWPLAIALPLALLAGWAAVSLLIRARALRAAGRRQ